MATVTIRRTNLTRELRRIKRNTKDPLDKHYLTTAIKNVDAYANVDAIRAKLTAHAKQT